MNLLQATKILAVCFLLFATVNAQSIYELPSGTKILVQMDNEINSKVSSVDDTFTTVIAEPVVVRETVVLPIGTIIEGRITKVTRASFGGQNGELEVKFETMRFMDGERREIEGVLVNGLKISSSSQTANILTVAGAAGIGGLLGAVSKADNGALIGAGIGAGAGGAVAYLKKGKDVKIKTDEKFEIEITKNVNLPVEDF